MEDLNQNIITDKPWVRHLLDTSLKVTEKAVLRWCSSAAATGENDLELDNYVTVFLEQMSILFEDLQTDIDAIHEKTLEKIEALFQKLHRLCGDLRLETPSIPHENVPLLELKRSLLQKVNEYEAEARTRRRELDLVQQEQAALCKRLGREPQFLSETPIPTSSEVEALRREIKALEAEVLEREARFIEQKEQITKVAKELEILANTSFEAEILDLSNKQVRITDSEMEQLQAFNDRVVTQFRSVHEEISKLKTRIDDLCDDLEIDAAGFKSMYSGNSFVVLSKLKVEANKLEEMKKSNLESIIINQRQKLIELRKKCHLGQEEGVLLAPFQSSEAAFKHQKEEIQHLKNYYQENENIFALLQKHEKCFIDLEKFELVSSGTDRYKNRGGQLLLEEQERTKLKRRIQKIEESLTTLAKPQDFRTFGLTIPEYIAKTHEDRAKEHRLKLSAKKGGRERAISPELFRINLFTASPCCSSKKKE